MNRIRIGVDVGGTNAVGVAVDADLHVVATARQPTRRGSDGVVVTVRDLVAELIATLGRDASAANGAFAGEIRVERTSATSGTAVEQVIDCVPPVTGHRVGPRSAQGWSKAVVEAESSSTPPVLDATRVAGGAAGPGRHAMTPLRDGARMNVRVASVGVGVPGIVAGGVVRHAVNLDVRQMDLAAALRDELGVPVAVDNDVRAAALGAYAVRGGSLAYLNLGTGIAAGIVVDGRVRSGSTGAAGEIGHVAIDPAGPECACGQRGCIEAFAGGAAIAHRWEGAARDLTGVVSDPRSAAPGATSDGLARGGETGSCLDTEGAPGDTSQPRDFADPGPPVPATLFEAADRGDASATRIRDDAVRAISAAARILVLTADPDRVVLGGGVARLGEPLRRLVVSDLSRAATRSPFLAELRIADRLEIEDPGSHAPAIGAALLAG